MKSYTDLEQSKKLAEILPLESADMGWNVFVDDSIRCLPIDDWDLVKDGSGNVKFYPAWNLAALLKYLSEIKPQEYTFTLTVSEGKWCLGCMVYGRGYIRDEFNDVPIDACVAMIEKLNELNLL